ncbi:MAG: methanol dehydrogenase [cytochrome c] subunit [Parahaliea sp.]
MNKIFHNKLTKTRIRAALGTTAIVFATSALAYDGTKCKEDGNCWEPKPGYPAKVENSEFDPKHNPKELNKQSLSITDMERRNALRAEHFKRTGKFEYDVKKIEGGK